MSAQLSQTEVQERTKILSDYIQESKLLFDLVEKNLKKGKMSVVFKNSEDMASYAAWNEDTREIALATSLKKPYDLLSYFVSIHCIIANRKLHKIDTNAYETAEAYADAIEYAQHKSLSNYNNLMLQLIKAFPNRLESDFCPDVTNHHSMMQAQTFEDRMKALRTPRLVHQGYSHYETLLVQYYQSHQKRSENFKESKEALEILECNAKESLAKLKKPLVKSNGTILRNVLTWIFGCGKTREKSNVPNERQTLNI